MMAAFQDFFYRRGGITALAVLALFWPVVLPVLALAGDEPAASKKSDDEDPFSPANELKGDPAASPEKKPVLPAGTWIKRNDTPIDPRIDFTVAVTPSIARRGETVKLTITGTPRRGYHTYPLTQRSADPAQDPAGLSKLTYAFTPGLQPLEPVTESDPQFETIEKVGVYLEHKNKFTWTQDILVLPDAEPGPKTLSLVIKMQVCNGTCIWGEPQFDVGLVVSDAAAGRLTAELQRRREAKPLPIKVVPLPETPASAPVPKSLAKERPAGIPSAAEQAPEPSPTGSSQETSLLPFILSGIIWGALSLLTPCVFPMIPITVSFFLKQSEKARHRTFLMASVYSATIAVVLTIGGVLLGRVLQPFSLHWTSNLFLGALFLFFALSLFGMYEIQLPSRMANFTSAQEGRGGLVGTMFMALTFTIISFTCVAPFYGGLIGLSATAQSASDLLRLVPGCLAFSVTFASPFFVLALFPSLLRTLPRSGSWMNTLKVVMGFLEVAAALKFLRASERNLFGKAEFFTYDLVLGMYVALALLCGFYLLRFYRLPHDDETSEPLGVPRLIFSLLFISLGLYLLPGLFKDNSGEQQRPAGSVFAWLDAFLLRDKFEGGGDSGESAGTAGPQVAKTSSRLVWTSNFQKALTEAEAQKKLVFLNFTGFN